MQNHRGGLILGLGIVSLVLCQLLGVVAWVMANADLREMDAGRMDPEGRSLTEAGKICGIIAVAMAVIGVLGFIVWLLFVAVFVAAGAASGA